MSDEMENVGSFVTLSDENGDEFTFEVLHTLEYGDKLYYALTESTTAENLDEPSELILLEGDLDADVESMELRPIEDDNTYDKIAELMSKELEEFFDIEE